MKGNNIPEALKGVPAFDSKIEGVNNASGENEEFGDCTGGSVNFTDFTAQKNNATISDAIRQNVRLMNPMTFIGDRETTVAEDLGLLYDYFAHLNLMPLAAILVAAFVGPVGLHFRYSHFQRVFPSW